MRKLPLIIFILLFSVEAWAVACNDTDIQNAIDGAGSGATIDVGSGSCSINITIDEPLTLRGGESGTTTLTNSLITIRGPSIRVTGFAFTSAPEPTIRVNFYYDGGHFEEPLSNIVIDNNTFVGVCSKQLIWVYDTSNPWDEASRIGTNSNVFVENNTFTGVSGCEDAGRAASVLGDYGASVVFRHNTSTNSKFDMHGVWSVSWGDYYCDWDYYQTHGSRNFEVYNNDFSGSFHDEMVTIRGGTGAIYSNTFSNTSGDAITLREYCTRNTGANCCGSYACPEDYPYRDQPGRGINNTLVPIYLWDNTHDGDPITGFDKSGNPTTVTHIMTLSDSGAVASCGEDISTFEDGVYKGGFSEGANRDYNDISALIQEDRDYYMDEKPAYTAYTCPHPLTGLSGTCDSDVAGVAGYNVAAVPSNAIQGMQISKVTE